MLDAQKRGKLLFRAHHRGIREMDIILGGYCDTHIDTMDAQKIDGLTAVLRINDQTLYQLLSIHSQSEFSIALAGFWRDAPDSIVLPASSLMADIWLWMRQNTSR